MASQELAATISKAAITALSRVGKTYQEQGLLHQALSPYLKVVAYYPESKEAAAAVEGVAAIAKTFEEQEQRRVAESVFDRLEYAARFRCWNGHQVTAEVRLS